MASRKRRLESTVTAIQRQHGAQALRRGLERAPKPPLAVSSTRCPHRLQRRPLGVMSLLSGRSTSGKVTLAYKLLANAQASGGAPAPTAVLVDMTQTADPDYLTRCGINLDRLLLVRPATNERAVHLILDLARSRQVNLVVVDSLADLVPPARPSSRAYAAT